jgi:hypothetical protein
MFLFYANMAYRSPPEPFHVEAARFTLKHLRMPSPPFNRGYPRFPRHLSQMARELPRDQRQRVAEQGNSAPTDVEMSET